MFTCASARVRVFFMGYFIGNAVKVVRWWRLRYTALYIGKMHLTSFVFAPLMFDALACVYDVRWLLFCRVDENKYKGSTGLFIEF